MATDELTPGHLDLGHEGWDGSDMWRTFVIWLFAIIALGAISVFAFNAVVDPMGLTGSGRFPLVTVDGAGRSAKAERLQGSSHEPGVLLLGSSSARNFDPKTVTRLSGQTAFNASMSAGRPADAFAMASLATEHFSARTPAATSTGATSKRSGPHVVYFLDVDTALAKNPPNAGLVTTPALRRQFGRLELVRMSLATFTPYLQRSTLELSTQSLRRYRNGERFVEPLAQRELRKDGFRARDPLRGTKGTRRFDLETERYRTSIYGTGDPAALDRTSQRFVERIVEDANARNDIPTIVIMPVNPKAVRILRPYGWQERYLAVRDFVQILASEHDVQVADLHDAKDVGLTEVDYYDNVHTTLEASNQILAELAERSALAKER